MPEFVIIGPPGTGKTQTIARQAAHAASLYGGTAVQVTSLTKAAAHEAAGRVTAIPEENVSTLHARAYRRLGGAIDIADTAKNIAAFNAWVSTVHHPRWAIPLAGRADDVETLLEADDYQSAGDLDDDLWYSQANLYRHQMIPQTAWPDSVRTGYALWCEWKAETGKLDFTDLIERALTETDNPGSDIEVQFVDEAQDLSRLELALVQHWGGTCRYTVLVGDPEQALFAWRGGDADAVLNGGNRETRILAQSYRVPYAVWERAMAWIARRPGYVAHDYWPRMEEDGPGAVTERPDIQLSDEYDCDLLADELSQQQGTVMALATCGYMLQPLIKALRDAGVPFYNPYRTRNGRWNPLGRRQTVDRLLAYVAIDSQVMGNAAHMWRPWEVRAWAAGLRVEGIFVRGQKETLTELPDGSSPADVLAAIEAATLPDALTALLNADPTWYRDHALRAVAQRLDYPITVLRRRGRRALETSPNIIIGTVHSVKGGEADTVYLAPNLSPAADEEYWHGETGETNVRRCFYVGMTRARRALHLLGVSPKALAVDWDG